MDAVGLYREGRLDEAIAALGAAVRDDPTDARRRTFLFELLCFAGDLDRAEKHLDVLARAGTKAEAGTLLYRAALHAERTRRATFAPGGLPPTTTAAPPVTGTLNGEPFASLTDADPRIGARLEIFAGGQYLWIALQHMASLTMDAPRRLRDLIWAAAIFKPGEGIESFELGEVLLPVLTPDAWTHEDGNVRLGRITEWRAAEGGSTLPIGQKLLLVDGEEFPFLEVRELVVHGAAADGEAGS